MLTAHQRITTSAFEILNSFSCMYVQVVTLDMENSATAQSKLRLYLS
jgi:hypothetical protein